MPVVNGKVVAPIDFIGTVASVLGSTSGDCVTLCTHPKINPAAIFRPRFMGGRTHVETTDFQSVLSQLVAPSSGTSGVSMKCVNYGIWLPYVTHLSNGYIWNASHVRWNPRPATLGDYTDITHFDGYNSKAAFANPVQSVVCSSGAIIKVTFRNPYVDDSITVRSMFGDNENAYFGFVVYEYTGDGPILSGTGAVTPKVFIHNYSTAQAITPQTVSSDITANRNKKYDIIPIVAVDYGGGDYEYYTLNISGTVPGFYRKNPGSSDIEFIYFRFAECTSGNPYYPDGDNLETGSSIGITQNCFSFALMMTSPFSKILATSDSTYDGLIRPGSMRIKASFRRQTDNKVFTKDFTSSNGLVMARQLGTNVLRMYILLNNSGNGVYDWAQSVAGTLAGFFSFSATFTINLNTSGANESNQFPAISWMANE